MKNEKIFNLRKFILLCLVMSFTMGCERELSDDAELAGFSTNGDVFIDTFSGGLDYFPFADSKFTAFSVDTETKYDGTAAMRFDIPNVGDPEGSYAGAIFRVDSGRDLSGFDALTFWAMGSQAGTIDQIGFGQDFEENKYLVTALDLRLSTNWTKFIIPIPDPSVLTQERGLFWYAEGPENGNGYTIWIDEVQFEKLGTIAQARPAIYNGIDTIEQSFTGTSFTLSGLTQTYNLGSGINQTVIAAPAYFEFTSSDTSVATVSNLGVVNVVGSGTATITASLAGVDAAGSLTIESVGDYIAAPVPTEDPENVISIFSDAYSNVPVDYYNGFFNGDGQTTQGGAPPTNFAGDEVIFYTDLNFVGIGTFLNVQPIDATEMTHLHVDINVQEAIDAGDFIRLQLLNSVQNNETSGSVTITSSELLSNEWASFDIPLEEFSGLGARNEIGLLFFISDTTISNIYVDNIYFYKDESVDDDEDVEPSSNVDDSDATQVALPIGFESSSLVYDFAGFEGADSEIVANPLQEGINPTATVMRSTKTNGAQFFAGTLLNLDAPIDFSSSQKLRIKVLSPKSDIPVRVRLENADNSVGIELDTNTTTMGEWEELEWDFSSMNTSADFVRIVVFFEFIPEVAGDGSTYYYDDIQIVD